jgi:galactokinase
MGNRDTGVHESRLEAVRMDMEGLREKFFEIYGNRECAPRFFTAPGRVNLIGEHTDYNGGFVLPAALTMSSTVAVRKRKDRTINLVATDLGEMVSASLDNLEPYKKIRWGNYQLGVADELQKAGYKLTGCDMLFHDTVPFGSGLSSSAAIEVATAIALATLGNEVHGIDRELDMIEIAKISQRAENNYVGVNCGIMDQFASAMGKKEHAIFLDCRDLSYSLVPLKLDGHKIVISNTKKKRSLADSKYNERRQECEEGLKYLKKRYPNVQWLGDITAEEYESVRHIIKDEAIRKRVDHVIYENARVLKSVKALSEGRLDEFGKLMIESHQSLKELYEVTGFELDTMVFTALEVDGVIGSRMTGAGFGGCTVSIVKEEAVDKFIDIVGKGYENKTDITPEFYVTTAGDGAREIKQTY